MQINPSLLANDDLKPPIFIGGMQRSGTSLMRAIIDSHPDVAVLEVDIPIWSVYYEKFALLDLNHYPNRYLLLIDMLSNPKLKTLTPRINDKALIDALHIKQAYSFCTIIQLIMEHYARQRGKTRWSIKMPQSEFYVKRIFDCFPSATMVQVIRDPRDVASSFKQRGWKYNIWNHRAEWGDSVRLAYQNEEQYEGYIKVFYEDLVSEPEAIIKQVCAIIVLDYHPDMLTLGKFASQINQSSSFGDMISSSDKKNKITSSAIGRFHDQLSHAEIQQYDKTIQLLATKTSYQATELSSRISFQMMIGALQRGIKQNIPYVFWMVKKVQYRAYYWRKYIAYILFKPQD